MSASPQKGGGGGGKGGRELKPKSRVLPRRLRFLFSVGPLLFFNLVTKTTLLGLGKDYWKTRPLTMLNTSCRVNLLIDEYNFTHSRFYMHLSLRVTNLNADCQLLNDGKI